MKTLADIASKFRDAFKTDPGTSDLDNEQPIHITVTLGDWRRLNAALSGAGWRPHTWKPLDREPVSCLLAFWNDEGDEPEALLSGIYVWSPERGFWSEIDGAKPTAPFFWIYEREITANVPPARDEIVQEPSLPEQRAMGVR